MRQGGREKTVGASETKTPVARMAQKGVMKKYTFESTTKGDTGMGRKLIAMGEFDGPGGNMLNGKDDDAANDAEFAAYKDKAFTVTAWVVNPPVVANDKGEYLVPESSKVSIAPYDVNNFEAWVYGAGLKASGKARSIATQGEVEDHVLTMGTQKTDLDAMSPDQLIATIQALRGAIAAGLSIGVANDAKLNSKVAEMVKSGEYSDVDGKVKAVKNGGRGK